MEAFLIVFILISRTFRNTAGHNDMTGETYTLPSFFSNESQKRKDAVNYEQLIIGTNYSRRNMRIISYYLMIKDDP